MAPPKPSTPPLGLTPKFIESLRPGGEPYDIKDKKCPGLRLRVLPTGRKVFRWVYWRQEPAEAGEQGSQGPAPARRQTTATIGPWSMNEEPGHVTLAQARQELERLKRAHEAGTLEEVVRSAGTRRLTPAEAGRLLREYAEDFYRLRILPKRKKPAEVRRTLDGYILPALGEKPLLAWLRDLQRARKDCRDVVLSIVARGHPTMAGMVFDHLKQFFEWLKGFGEDVPVSPMEGLDKDALGCVKRRRKRYLSETEIPLFWHAVEERRGDEGLRPDDAACSFPQCGRLARAKGLCFGHYRQMKRGRPLAPLEGISRQVQLGLRFLLLVPVRCGEILQAEWREVELERGLWTVPVAHQKLLPKQLEYAEERRVPLTPMVLEILEELRGLAGSSPYVLSSPEVPGAALTEKALMHALGGLQAKEKRRGGKKVPVKPVLDLPGGHLVVHDLRHTFRTLAPKHCNVLPFFAERCLGHVESGASGMEGYYSHGDYFEQRKDALGRWAEYVGQLVAAEKSNVAFLPARGAR